MIRYFPFFTCSWTGKLTEQNSNQLYIICCEYDVVLVFAITFDRKHQRNCLFEFLAEPVGKCDVFVRWDGGTTNAATKCLNKRDAEFFLICIALQIF